MKRPAYRVPENWIARFLEPRHPESVASFRLIAGLTATALRDETLSDEDLELVVGHVRGPSTVMADAAQDMLGKLAMAFPAALAAVETLAGDAKANVRGRALAALRDGTATSVHARVYAASLTDTSKKLRARAAENIRAQRIGSLVPALEEAVAREKDAGVRAVLESELALLRDGYVVARSGDEVTVTVASPAGTVTELLDARQIATGVPEWVEQQSAEWRRLVGAADV